MHMTGFEYSTKKEDHWLYKMSGKGQLILAVVIMLLLVVSIAFAQEPTKTQETLEQRIARLTALEAKKLANETDLDRMIRLRAEKRRIDRETKQAEEAVRKNDSPDMREARKQVEKETKRAEALRKDAAQVLARAAISGCTDVNVDARAEQTSWLNVTTSVRIVNTTPLTWNIETPSRGIGVAVRGLCPGGSITLSFARTFADSQYENIALVAVSQPLVGNTVITEQFSLSLYVGNIDYHQHDVQIWQLTRRQ